MHQEREREKEREGNYLNEDEESFETGSGFEHEAGVLSEPFDVAFVSGVDKDRGVILCSAPVLAVDQVPLLESAVALGIVVEVIEDLSEEFLFVEFAAFGCERLLKLWLDCC